MLLVVHIRRLVDQHVGDAVCDRIAPLEPRVVQAVLVCEVEQRALVLRACQHLEQERVECHRFLSYAFVIGSCALLIGCLVIGWPGYAPEDVKALLRSYGFATVMGLRESWVCGASPLISRMRSRTSRTWVAHSDSVRASTFSRSKGSVFEVRRLNHQSG